MYGVPVDSWVLSTSQWSCRVMPATTSQPTATLACMAAIAIGAWYSQGVAMITPSRPRCSISRFQALTSPSWPYALGAGLPALATMSMPRLSMIGSISHSATTSTSSRRTSSFSNTWPRMPVPIRPSRTLRPRAQAGVFGSRLVAATAALAAMNSLRFMDSTSCEDRTGRDRRGGSIRTYSRR